MRTVISRDGTPIAFEQAGKGSSLLLVHGTATIRAQWASIFEEYFTVAAMDRRGRGDSGDTADYSIEREFEDVKAVVAALDPPVFLFGHSYGGLCALGAAMQIDRLSGLILYEPLILDEGESGVSAAQLSRMEALLAEGDREGVVKYLYREIAGMSEDEVSGMAASPSWRARVDTAQTIPRETRAEDTYRLPMDRTRRMSVPVLLLVGGDSPEIFRRTAAKLERLLPDVRTVVMPGQQHIAMYTAPDLVVAAVREFQREIG
jgi:pimeloyl-ACP methyl ester carboxylesterase